MAKHLVPILGFVVAFIGAVSAGITEEEKSALKAVIIPVLEECGKEFGMSKEDVLTAKKSEDNGSINPCFFACIMKKTDIMDAEGKYMPDVSKAVHAKYLHDKKLVSKLDAISDECASVNDIDVSDGAEGCERAKHLIICITEHKDFFSIFED